MTDWTCSINRLTQCFLWWSMDCSCKPPTIFSLIFTFAYYNLLKRGVRIALRSKVNDCMITGLRIVDSILAVGRGQRQLILGDRYTGKTSVYLSLALKLACINVVGAADGFGTRRLFGIYVGINQNLTKLSKLICLFGVINWFSLILATHSSSSSLLSFTIPLVAAVNTCHRYWLIHHNVVDV